MIVREFPPNPESMPGHPSLPTLIVSDDVEHAVLCADGSRHFVSNIPGEYVDQCLVIADDQARLTCAKPPHRHVIRHIITTGWSPA